MRYLTLLLCLFCFGAQAQNLTRPDITPVGDTLYAPEAQSYQWLRDGIEIPGATGRWFLLDQTGVYTVRARSLVSDPFVFDLPKTVVVTGAVLDEFLRPIAGAAVNGDARTDAEGRFYISMTRAERLTVRAEARGYYAHTVGFMPTAGDTQFVLVHLAKKVVTHKLNADTGGTISQGGFWLTLPPKSVVDENGKAYTGEIQLSVVARRPGDRDFAQRMPGGDFMAVDKTGESKVLYSYGFTGVEMTTTEGEPLNMAAGSEATIEFLITEEQRPGAPDEMPLWHFDEDKGMWQEAGVVRKEGLTYKAEVGHFSWWNYDFPQERAYLKMRAVTCWGQAAPGVRVSVEQREGYADVEGWVGGIVPANMPLHVHVMNFDTIVTIAEGDTLNLGTFEAGWGASEAFGLADTNNILTVYAYGETEGVEYSLDGETWQREPVFVLQGDSMPAQGWARVEGCDTTRFTLTRPGYFRDCRVYDAPSLDRLPTYRTILDILGATRPVYQAKRI